MSVEEDEAEYNNNKNTKRKKSSIECLTIFFPFLTLNSRIAMVCLCSVKECAFCVFSYLVVKCRVMHFPFHNTGPLL